MEEIKAPEGIFLSDNVSDEVSFPFLETNQSDPATKLPIDVARNRAVRYSFAQGDLSPERVSTMEHAIRNGNEPIERAKAYTQELIDHQRTRQELVSEYVRKKAMSGQTPSYDDTRELLNLNAVEMDGSSPETILERKYARRAMSSAMSSNQTVSNVMDGIGLIDPEDHEDAENILDSIDKHTDILEKQQVARKLVEEAEAESHTGLGHLAMSALSVLGRTPTASFTADDAYTAETFIPFYNWYKLSNASGQGDGGFLLGSDLDNQVKGMYQNLSTKDFEIVARKTMQDLKSGMTGNPHLSTQFAQALTGYGSAQSTLDNVSSVLDLSAIPVTKAVAIAKTGVGRTIAEVTAIRDVTKALMKRNPNPIDVLAKAGDTARASHLAAMKAVSDVASNTGQVKSWDELVGRVPSLLAPETILSGSSANMTVEQANSLVNQLRDQAATLVNGVLVRPLKIARLEEKELDVAISAAREQFILEKPHLNTAVRDVIPINSYNTLGNIDSIAIRLGDMKGGLFDSIDAADNIAKNVYMLDGYTIGTQHGKFYVQYVKNVDELKITVRNAIATTTKNQSPTGLLAQLNSLVPFSGKKQVLPGNTGADLSVAAVGVSGISSAYKQVAQTIGDLPKNSTIRNWFKDAIGLDKSSRADFETFVTRQRDYTDPLTGQRGTFSTSVGKFDSDWAHQFGRVPTEKERLAYFSYTQINDLDWVARNLNIYKSKVRTGVESFQFKFNNIYGHKTAKIEGKVLKEIPNVSENAGILVWDENMNRSLELLPNKIPNDTSNVIKDAIDKSFNWSYKKGKLDKPNEEVLRSIIKRILPQVDSSEHVLTDKLKMKTSGFFDLKTGRVNLGTSNDRLRAINDAFHEATHSLVHHTQFTKTEYETLLNAAKKAGTYDETFHKKYYSKYYKTKESINERLNDERIATFVGDWGDFLTNTRNKDLVGKLRVPQNVQDIYNIPEVKRILDDIDNGVIGSRRVLAQDLKKPVSFHEEISTKPISDIKNEPTKNYFQKNFTSNKKIRDLIEQGYKVIQIDDFGEDVLRNTTGLKVPKGSIHYILSKESHITSPLDFKQIPYKPGGHVEVAENWFIRQPRVKQGPGPGNTRENVYHGDINAYSVRTEQEARAFETKMNQARALLVNARSVKDTRLLRMFVEKNLPMSYRDFMLAFDPKEGRFDANAPFLVSPKGQSSWKAHNLSDYYDGPIRSSRDSAHSLYNNNVDIQYALERGDDIRSITNVGSDTAPVFNFRGSDKLDPISTLDNAVSQLMNGRLMGDLKVKSTENFISQFAKVMRTDIAELRRDPYRYLVSPEWKSDLKGADRSVLAAAKNFRRATLEFMGTKSDTQKYIDGIRQRLAEDILNKFGEKAYDVTSPLLLKSYNPLSFMRSVAFESHMGLFNPRQLLVQSMATAHITAIEGPVRGMKAMSAAAFAKYALISGRTEVLDEFANKISKFAGMKPEHFKEAYHALISSNWQKVGREVADLASFTQESAVANTATKFLNSGHFFFKHGEQYSRLASWFAAYDRWRVANPTKAFKGPAIRDVLDRAELLSGDMTAAANATWQKGILSVPTQFSAWSIRLAEQLLPFYSNRLTGTEKFRAFMTYGALFGFPVALSGEVGVWPVHTEIKKELLTRGIDTDEGQISKMLNDGLLSILTEHLVGTKMNVGESIGPSGINIFHDALAGKDDSMYKLFTGAAGSTIGGYLESLAPFEMAALNVFRSDEEYYPLTQRDFELFASNVTTANSGLKAWYAANLGIYISKNETVMDDKVDGWTGLFMGLTGFTPQRVSDAFAALEAGTDLVDAQKHIRKEAVKDYKRMLQSNDVDEKIAYAKRAKLNFNAGHFRPEQAHAIMQDAYKSSADPVTSTAASRLRRLSPEADIQFHEKAKRKVQEGKE